MIETPLLGRTVMPSQIHFDAIALLKADHRKGNPVDEKEAFV
jgi:hypothetical protein